jgi:uncharacterized protein YeeX (DUF496 family)
MKIELTDKQRRLIRDSLCEMLFIAGSSEYYTENYAMEDIGELLEIMSRNYEEEEEDE